MTGRSTAANIDDYIAEFPPETQKAMEEVRGIVRKTAPNTVETISYAIPTFDLDGKHLVHFAGYKKHIGFYPTPRGIQQFAEELKSYKTSTGAVQFPLDQPLPADLIRRMVEFRLQESVRKPPK